MIRERSTARPLSHLASTLLLAQMVLCSRRSICFHARRPVFAKRRCRFGRRSPVPEDQSKVIIERYYSKLCTDETLGMLNHGYRDRVKRGVESSVADLCRELSWKPPNGRFADVSTLEAIILLLQCNALCSRFGHIRRISARLRSSYQSYKLSHMRDCIQEGSARTLGLCIRLATRQRLVLVILRLLCLWLVLCYHHRGVFTLPQLAQEPAITCDHLYLKELAERIWHRSSFRRYGTRRSGAYHPAAIPCDVGNLIQ